MEMRRVVTDIDKDGKSYVKWDGEVQAKTGRPGFSFFPMWATKKLPVETTGEDPNTWEIGTSLANGSVFRIGRYEPGTSARWHRTDSVDYAICLSGEMWMQLDKGEVHLKPGDVVIQRGTNHNWVNKRTETCLLIFVLIATEGGKSTGW